MAERIIKNIHNVFKQYRKVNLVNPYWFSKPFESTWRTSNTTTGSSTATQIRLPLYNGGTYSFTVNWGDGTSDNITVWNQAQTTHTYAVAGDYTIKINGICVGWRFNNVGDRAKILSIKTWGNLRLGNLGSYFYGCTNLNLSSTSDLPDLTGITSFSDFFRECTSITTINKINEWNVANIDNMSSMFYNCRTFNQNLGSWNVSNVTSFSFMFAGTSNGVFNNGGNSSINNWYIKTTGPVNMSGMFVFQPVFNQPLDNWNMTAVVNISSMFQECIAFNQSLSNWERTGSTLSNVTSLSQTFLRAKAFNQNISNWNVSNVTSFVSAFREATAFNNGLASGIGSTMNWTIKNTGTISMNGMFRDAVNFNQTLSSWDMSRVTDIAQMFYQSSKFNNGLASGVSGTMPWNVSNVTTMLDTFYFAQVFNQDISSWNVSNVTNMNRAFGFATAFNQNLGSWNISNVLDFTNFLVNKTPATFSTANLDAIYNGWSSRPVKPSIIITFGTAKYTAAGSAGRAILTGAPNNWVITDGGI